MTSADRKEAAKRYAEWLTSKELRFNFPSEAAEFGTAMRNGIHNSTPPVHLWHRVLPVLKIMELVRERFGPTTITSAYRDRLYNIAIGGVGDSRHSQNDAIDFRCRDGSPTQWALFLRGLRDAGQFQGGVGVYASWVHVDTRGSNADWGRA